MGVRVVVLGEVAAAMSPGECDLDGAAEATDAITRAVRSGFRRLLLHLSQVRYLDSSGVQVLLRARGELEAEAGRLVVVGIQGQPERELDLLGLRRVLHGVGSREDALACLSDTV